ncbi:MAG: hypothetical protein EPO59_11020 [Bosea sp. (in: a-proteobacteria)]|nr:MAG: hypothetical protein EPO59_11020 [Bosea sp. (in: a-proteobacteria)]
MLKTAFALAVLQAAGAGALAQGPLRIGMTASDISLTSGQTDNGGEGQRLMGDTVDDALINWDLSSATKPADPMPGLPLTCDSTRPMPAGRNDSQKALRREVPDGSDVPAVSAVRNLDKLLAPPATAAAHQARSERLPFAAAGVAPSRNPALPKRRGSAIQLPRLAPVAQLDRALPSEGRCQAFFEKEGDADYRENQGVVSSGVAVR